MRERALEPLDARICHNHSLSDLEKGLRNRHLAAGGAPARVPLKGVEAMSHPMRITAFVCAAAFAVTFSSALGPPGFAEEASDAGPDRLAPLDLFELEYAGQPQISPDGKRVIYVRSFADVFTDQFHSNLWIIDADGSGHRPLTTGNRNDSSPRWSPDGARVAYISPGERAPQLFVRWLDSGQTARLTNLAFPPERLAWSPDGRWIAFTTFVPTEPPAVAELPEPPEGAEWAEGATVIDRLIYRFDQYGYLKPGFVHLFVVPAEGGTPRQISSGDFQHGGPTAAYAGDPVWTPDGKHILLSAARRDDWEFEMFDTEIYEFSVADGSVRALTRRKGPDGNPAISSDGKKIAYLGFDERYQGYQVSRLYVMDRDGGNSRVVSADLDRSVWSMRWAADGKGLLVHYDDEGNTWLGLMKLNGKLRPLAGNGGAPGWGAYGGGDYSTNGRTYAYAWTRPQVPPSIAVGELSGGKPRVITSLNEDLLAHKGLAEAEEIWFESSHDGRKIQGWILKPPDFDPKQKYPLILEIHGGPFANYGPRFDPEFQLYAASGYVVLYVNPRGSTSYGEEFGNLIHHAYPGDDYYDLISGVDAVLARGYVDADNLFVTGGSGGGVLTCWLIGRTSRFRAAAAAYPVINWYSFLLTTDISSYVQKHWFPGPPWDHPEHYEKRSLLSVVKNVKTPTMLITGEDDYRTPISESEQYYQALKLLGVESVMVRVPDEPHGIADRPSHAMSKILHVIGWFDKHRQTP
jgi:acylaminoacyl-peptidase